VPPPDGTLPDLAFQPASGSSAGGNSPCRCHAVAGGESFNPPPAHPPEETGPALPLHAGRCQVSTRLRLIRRRKPRVEVGSHSGPTVSTRLRLIRRRKHDAAHLLTGGPRSGFNPPPAHPPEETSNVLPASPITAEFQPASGSSAGGNAVLADFSLCFHVSTRLRLIRRRKPSAVTRVPPSHRRFQPASGSSAGGNLIAGHVRTAGGPFQPASGSSAGGNRSWSGSRSGSVSSFNPPPAHPPEETRTAATVAAVSRRVSTRLRLIRRRKRNGCGPLVVACTVSTRLRLIRRRKPVGGKQCSIP